MSDVEQRYNDLMDAAFALRDAARAEDWDKVADLWDGFLLQFDALQSYQANHPDWAEHRLGSREFCADRLRQIIDCHEEVSNLVRDRHQVLREELGSVHNSARLRQAYK